MAAVVAKPLFGLSVSAATQYDRQVSSSAEVPSTRQDISVVTTYL